MSAVEETHTLSPGLEAKRQELRRILERGRKVLVAYSGGVDSALILKVATDTLGRDNAIGVIAKSETLTDYEFVEAKRLADENGFNLRIISYSELEIDNYAQNPINRCYFCKSELYGQLQSELEASGAEVICNGDNYDDIGDHRPGMKAAQEAHVISPLKDAKMRKDDIRTLARHLGLSNWDKPSGACLSSRIPYGQAVTREKLDAVGQAEKLLLDLGCRQVRVRHHDKIARIEVGAEDIARLLDPQTRQTIVQTFKSLGFAYVALDLEGYRTGSLNETLPDNAK